MFLWIRASLSSKNRSVSQLHSIGKPVFVQPRRCFFNISLAGFLAATEPTLTLANLVTSAAMCLLDCFFLRMNEFRRMEERNADGCEYRHNLAMSAYKVKLWIR